MNNRNLSHALVLAMALSVGCGSVADGVDDEEAFLDRYLELHAEIEAQASAVCDCYAQLPNRYPSKDACMNDWYEPPTPQQFVCIEDAAALDLEASNTVLDCEIAAGQEFSRCLEETLSCDDLMNTYLTCDSQFQGDLADCPALPLNVQEALAACR